MPKTAIIFISVFLSLGTFLNAQTGDSPFDILPEKLGDAYRDAEQALIYRDFDGALKLFTKILKKYPEFVPALRGIGACHILMSEYDLAAKYYDKALELGPRFSRALYYETADAHFKSGNYYLAREIFIEFDSLSNLPISSFSYNGSAEQFAEQEYYDKIERSIRACNVAMDSIKFLNIAKVENLGESINTKGDEYFPFVSNDQKLIFYTARKNENADENLFYSSAPFGKWRIGQKVNNDFNTDFHEGMTTLIRDGRKMIFTACQREGILGPCDLWQADVKGEKILEPRPVIGYVNSPMWESQAAISCDGSELYFASNREGGEGGTDIWMCTRLDDGRWAEPKNLGPNVNTEGDEEAPFITNDGKVLYFSSTGHLGMGEQDIFFTRRGADSMWDFPVNLGTPVNSSYRELGFFLSADGKTGYLASNRKGGIGGMDIYKFTLSDQLNSDPITFVEGHVIDSILKTPIPNATIQFENRTDVQSDEEGRFFICVKGDDMIDFEVLEKDYHKYKRKKTIPIWDNKNFYKLEIMMDPLFRLPVYNEPLDIDLETPISDVSFPNSKEIKHQLFYGFDSDELTADMKDDLLGFLQTTFSGNPVMSVEIVGYADDIGADSYNLILSEKRAKAVGVFLKDKGIRVDKIYIEGKGEQKSSGKPKWKNRRVEVVVRVDEG
ncbi:MAG: OmpA family protein [Saprospiraceae bacterium]|jgi:outer membrane protein OmpA-like peptidoglycan-associated protein/tetratricopeptide (TPR) repeat protein|nr:OmpA family protein [Saprospiraceae bacterium]